MKTIVLMLLTLLPSFVVAQELKGDWPQWLGPRRDGISRQGGWSTDWPEEGLKQLWTRDVGIGFSSITMTDGLLYTMGNQEGREHVWCMERVAGRVLWSHDYESDLVANLYEGGPGSTPTIDGEHLYTVGKEGQLFCFECRTGKILWQRSLQDELEMELPEWGFNGSPVIVGNHLLLEAGRVVAFDKRSGEKIWQTPPHRAGYGSVTPFTHSGQSLLASLDCDGLRVVKADSGAPIAFVEWTSPFRTNSTTPIVRGDSIFISSGYNVGCGLFTLKEGALTEQYSNRGMRNHFNNSILWDDHLYGFDGNSNLGRIVHLTCLDFRTGEVKWKHQGLGCGSLIVADGKLLILSEDGELVVAEANPEEYKELARSSLLGGRCWTVPTLIDGRVYARNADGKLVCAEVPRSRSE